MSWPNRASTLIFSLSAGLSLVHCSKTVGGQGTNKDGKSCDLGSSGCRCYGNGSCDSRLHCDDGYCTSEVDSNPGMGGDGSGGSGDPDPGDGDMASGGHDGETGGSPGDGDAGGATGDGGSEGNGSGGQAMDCDHEGFSTVEVVALENPALVYSAQTATSGPGAELRLELFYNGGTGAPTEPYEFSDWENYASCSTCALIYDCNDIDSVSFDTCTMYEVHSGTLDVQTNENGADPGEFTATLTDILAREVTFDGQISFQSVPVPDGGTWCIDSMSIDVVTF